MELLIKSISVPGGFAESKSASTPATAGVAIEVPLATINDPPGIVERISAPGATISGSTTPVIEGPREDQKVGLL